MIDKYILAGILTIVFICYCLWVYNYWKLRGRYNEV